MEPNEQAAQEPAVKEQPEAKTEPLWKERPFSDGKMLKYAEQAGINLKDEDEEPAERMTEEQAKPPEKKR